MAGLPGWPFLFFGAFVSLYLDTLPSPNNHCMDLQYHVDQEYDHIDFSDQSPLRSEFECCVFRGCNFAEADLSSCRFIDCEFIECDLSNARITEAVFRDLQFKECKVLGVTFERCKPLGFAISFHKCQLNHSTFFEMKLSHCSFTHCQLHSVDFGQAEMQGVTMTNCDLRETIFEGTNLQKADLTHSVNFIIDPELNRLKGAKFSLSQVTRLLDKYGLSIDGDS